MKVTRDLESDRNWQTYALGGMLVQVMWFVFRHSLKEESAQF